MIIKNSTMTSEDKIGSLEEEAFKRKERLKKLKRKLEEEGKNENKISADTPSLPKLVVHNILLLFYM